MCYIYGSVDQAVNDCPMCKVFPHSKCPHQRDICRNRDSHPRYDILFLKNAEVDWFNGCGYCKWAAINSQKHSGYLNPGWPGCCRPPAASEFRMIQAADWRSVSIVHHVPIPQEIKLALEGLAKRGSPIPTLSASGGRSGSGSGRPSIPSFDRRNSGNANKSSSASGKGPSGRGRSGGSPQQLYQTIGSNLSRTSSGTAISSSVPTSSVFEQYQGQRRQTYPEHGDKRVMGSHSSHSSPSRKHIDLDSATAPRRRSHDMRRPTVTPAIPSVSVSDVVVDSRPQNNQTSARRRASVSSSNLPPAKSSTPPRSERPASFVIPRTQKKDEDEVSSASSSSGSEGLGSMSDSTVTSDGGFTDYLSDESEAELQRQAEARAALVAQNQAEEMEFKAARQQLAHVDLRPPKSWNPTNIPYTSFSKLSVAAPSPGNSTSPPHAAQTRS